MKHLGLGLVGALLATTSHAADMPVKAPAYKAPAAVPMTWTGFYVGAHVGYGWGHTHKTNVNGNAAYPAGTEETADQNGVLGGLQLGYNYQFAPNWLVGVEGEYSWADVKGDASQASVVPGFTATRLSSTHTKVDWIATATGRLGYAMNDWLIYAKGGAAWARKATDSNTINPAAGNLLLTNVTGDVTRFGWTVGGGIEWAFTKNWSAKAEYDYLDFGSKNENNNATYFNGASGLAVLTRDVNLHIHEVKFGINYHFGGPL
jgi:outer membrane immunogenic protein